MKKFLCIFMSAALLISFSACNSMSKTLQGGLIGGGGGAAVGAGIGALIGKGKGAAIGGAIGAVGAIFRCHYICNKKILNYFFSLTREY